MLFKSSVVVASRRQAWASTSSMWVAYLVLDHRSGLTLYAQYHRTVPFDALLGGGEGLFETRMMTVTDLDFSGGRTRGPWRATGSQEYAQGCETMICIVLSSPAV